MPRKKLAVPTHDDEWDIAETGEFRREVDKHAGTVSFWLAGWDVEHPGGMRMQVSDDPDGGPHLTLPVGEEGGHRLWGYSLADLREMSEA